MDDDDDNYLPLNERIDLINRNDPSVTKFELYEGQSVTEDQIRALFRGMQQNTHVRKLDLCCTHNRLRPTVCQELLPPLLQENLSIRYLQFPENMTNAEFLPSVDALCNPIDQQWVYCHKTTMETLSLRGCDIRGLDGGEMVGQLITSNPHITTINLNCNNNLGPVGASRIAAALGDENCVLKTLNLGWCGIGDEGVDALCTALQVNNSLETFGFYSNKITDEGYRTLAGSLPNVSGLQKILFGWEQHQVSAAVLQQVMDGLQKNQSLQRIVARRHKHLSEEQRREWGTCCAFVGACNKMKSHLLDEVRDAVRDGRVGPVPIPIGPLLWWCCRQGSSEVQASLIHPLLCSRAIELPGLADIASEDG